MVPFVIFGLTFDSQLLPMMVRNEIDECEFISKIIGTKLILNRIKVTFSPRITLSKD